MDHWVKMIRGLDSQGEYTKCLSKKASLRIQV